jgi:hypothetical protein
MAPVSSIARMLGLTPGKTRRGNHPSAARRRRSLVSRGRLADVVVTFVSIVFSPTRKR